MKTKYSQTLEEYKLLQAKLSAGGGVDFAKIGKKLAELKPIVDKIEQLQTLESLLLETDLTNADKEYNKEEAKKSEAAIDEALIPKDPMTEKDVIVEIRAAAGGDEAALFAAELFRAYTLYAENSVWKCHVISSSRNDLGGFKEIIFEITGAKVYDKMRFESGVHRVQRVPQTEKSGRVHTSTVTVVVLPIIEEGEFKIDAKDLKIETSTSRGAGGQSVNTTYSAIKITHLPTGITASSQDERSQIQNRAKAMEVLTARVFAAENEKKRKELTAKRRSMIGTGDRSEKIRTYNFPQDRVTDHRINESFKQISLIIEGGLDPIFTSLLAAEKNLAKENLNAEN